MASKRTLNAKNLEALGTRRLAELLLEIGTGNAAIKRRLRLELASVEGAAAVAGEVRKRLSTIARSRSFVDWQNRRALVGDLETQRCAIVEKVARHDPVEGLELMWRFLALAGSVLERCDDSDGTVSDVFDRAAGDLGEIASAAKPAPATLADDAFRALNDDDHGQCGSLIRILAPALGQEGLEHLKCRVQSAWAGTNRGRGALMEIADAQGDVDLYIAQHDERRRKAPGIAAGIARRLLAAGRADDALQAVDAAEHRTSAWGGWQWADHGWTNARIDVLDALGRGEEAQRDRWSCFEQSLSAAHLRDYLKRLPDFDDIEAEERGLHHAENVDNPLLALSFLVSWPALDRAAALVLRQAARLDGEDYVVLSKAAEALAGKHPFAATLALRSMIDFALNAGRSRRYKYAARHLLECSSLASAIDDFGEFETHDAYEARLRREHGRKTSFWTYVR